MTTRSSIIEQAAKRLEELRRSGVAAPQPLDRRQPSSAIALGRLTTGGRPEATAAQRSHFPTAAKQSGEVEIDLARLGKMGYLIPGDTQTMVASEFRHIKRPLLRNVAAEGGAVGRSSLIMITSAVAGEGKTFCAINLAMSIAMEVDTSVLLVDADVVRPALLERLGLAPKPGLLDVLTGEAPNLSDVILKTSVPKLSILPAGAPRAMATELLASAAMGALLLDLATRYSDRVVVLDAPPLLLTTESPVLASMVGQVVIVVDSERTPVPKVTQAFARVEACPVVLSLLNKCSEPAVSDGYGYGYT
jgi:receptor protein-tyrosine kinase